MTHSYKSLAPAGQRSMSPQSRQLIHETGWWGDIRILTRRTRASYEGFCKKKSKAPRSQALTRESTSRRPRQRNPCLPVSSFFFSFWFFSPPQLRLSDFTNFTWQHVFSTATFDWYRNFGNLSTLLHTDQSVLTAWSIITREITQTRVNECESMFCGCAPVMSEKLRCNG